MGQWVVLADGSLATVAVVKNSGKHQWASIVNEDGRQVSVVFTDDGTVHRDPKIRKGSPGNVVADAPSKLTLPLTEGQRVILRDGTLATAKHGSSPRILNLFDGSKCVSVVYAATGRGNGDGGVDHEGDAVADAD